MVKTTLPERPEPAKGKDGKRLMSAVPHWLRQACKRKLRTAVSSLATRLNDLVQKGTAIEPDASLGLKWNIREGELGLVGKPSKRDVDAELEAPERSPEELWRELLEGADLWKDWDDGRKALLVFLVDTSEAERQTMTKSVEIVPRIPDYGAFDRLTLELPINAAIVDDAQKVGGMAAG